MRRTARSPRQTDFALAPPSSPVRVAVDSRRVTGWAIALSALLGCASATSADPLQHRGPSHNTASAVAQLATPGISTPDDLRPLPAPRGVRVRLADGVTITGVITSWSDNGLLGSFGLRRWTDIRPTDTNSLFRRLMDQSNPDHWLALGRVLLLSPGGAGLGESAFRRARGIDRGVEGRIAAIRKEVAQTLAGPGPAPDRLRVDSPESRPWPATPWRPLSINERNAAVKIHREDAAALLSLAGLDPLDLEPIESDRLLVYSDCDRTEAARLTVRLEQTIDQFDRLFTGPPGTPITGSSVVAEFWGKAVVIVTADRAAFRQLQQRVFLQLDRPEVTTMLHPIGAKTIIVAFTGGAGGDLEARLTRSLVHALLHRTISPVRLPPWANEGLAEIFAARAAPDLLSLGIRRRSALEFIRAGGDVWRLVNSGYSDPGWPGPNAPDGEPVGPGVGRLIVDLMIKDRPAAFVEWVGAVKRGDDWRGALERRFGVSLRRLVETAVGFHRFND